MASSGPRDLFTEEKEAIISEQSSVGMDESLDGIKMSNYQTAVKKGLDDEEDEGAESERLIADGDESTPGRIEFDALKSERNTINSSQKTVESQFCELMKILIGSMFTLFVLSILFLLFHKQLSAKYQKAISDLKSNNFEEIPIIALLFVIFEIVMVPGSVIYTVCGYAFNQGLGNTGKAILYGTILCFNTSSTASLLTFLISRYALPIDKKKLRREMLTVYAVDFEAESNLMRMQALLRIIPLFPMQVLNVFIATNENISICQFLISYISFIPGTLLYIFIGASLKDISDAISTQGLYSSNPAAFSFIASTLLMTLVFIAYTIYKVKNHFNSILLMVSKTFWDQQDDKNHNYIYNKDIEALAGQGLLENDGNDNKNCGRATI